MKASLTYASTPELRVAWNKACDDADREKREWIADLRARGFKASHPNDGWVNREENEVHLAYPQFDDGVQIGDKLMLGWPGPHSSLRPVRITDERFGFSEMRYLQFKDEL